MKTLAGGSRRTRRMRGGDDRAAYSFLSFYKYSQKPGKEVGVSVLASDLSRNAVPAGAGNAMKSLMELARVDVRADPTIDVKAHNDNLKSAFEAAYDEAVATGKIRAVRPDYGGGSRRTRKGRRVPRTRRRR